MADLLELAAIEKAEKDVQGKLEGGFESESFRFGKLILEDKLEGLPEDIKRKFWIVFDKELSLSNFQPEDIRWFSLYLDILKIDMMESQPEMNMTFDAAMNFDMLKMKTVAKTLRSTGGMIRERGLLAQQHQIKQFITSEGERPQGGIMSKISGFFGGRK